MARLEEQVKENTQAIGEIKNDLKTIKDNHLYHIEKDMEKQSKLIEKMDMRLWGILILLVGSVVVAFVKGG